MPEVVARFLPTRELPRNPNLEQLRKQAKDLLDRYAAADPSGAALRPCAGYLFQLGSSKVRMGLPSGCGKK
jgi:hypothetical protein